MTSNVKGTGSTNININKSCLSFNGSNTYVSISHNEVISFDETESYSISIWMKAPYTGHSNDIPRIISKGDNYTIRRAASNADQTRFTITDGVNTVFVTDSSNIYDDTWHHLCMIIDRNSDNLIVYRDNQLVGSEDISSVGDTSNTDDLYLGSYPHDANFLKGFIDETRIYNRALDDTEIKKLYNFLEVDDDLVSHWKFNERSGTTLYDSVGNLDGIIDGATWADRSILCWASKWDESNYETVFETFLNAGDRNYIYKHITPGAVIELYNILSKPTYIDSTFQGKNTITISPVNPGISNLREEILLGVKSFSDTFLNKDLFSVKIECTKIEEL
jgi:hypothetical protein